MCEFLSACICRDGRLVCDGIHGHAELARRYIVGENDTGTQCFWELELPPDKWVSTIAVTNALRTSQEPPPDRVIETAASLIAELASLNGISRTLPWLAVLRYGCHQSMPSDVRVIVLFDTATLDVVDGSQVVICMFGSSKVGKMLGSSKVGKMLGSSYIGEMREHSRVDQMFESSRVGHMWDSSRVGYMWGSSRVDKMRNSSRVGQMSGSSLVCQMSGSSRVGKMTSFSYIDQMREYSQVGKMFDASRIGEIRGCSRIDQMFDYSRIGQICNPTPGLPDV